MATHTNDKAFRQDFRNALPAPLELLSQALKETLERSYREMLGQVAEYINHGRLPIPVKTKRTAAEKREYHTRYMARRRAKLKAAAEAAVARPGSKPPIVAWGREAYHAYGVAKRAQARARA